jgi:hypothetical protein
LDVIQTTMKVLIVYQVVIDRLKYDEDALLEEEKKKMKNEE